MSWKDFYMEAQKANYPQMVERFAIVEEEALPRSLSREEFGAMQKQNPRLIQMRAGGLVYLTEPPQQLEAIWQTSKE